jgi:hypothetical protein
MWYFHDGAPPHYIQNAAQEIRENRDILNRVQLSWIRRTEACIVNDGRHFEQLLVVLFYAFTHNYSIFTSLFKLLLFSD